MADTSSNERSDPADRAAGRAASDRLAHSWPDRSWIEDAPSAAWAAGAIERFGELLREQPAMFKASRTGSERGAESLSPRPYQGVLEALQNADDVKATELRLAVLRGDPSVLLLGHDGAVVDLGHAGAMSLPWLTTKGDDAQASGRFGIGQQTLRSLGGPIEVHCPPFHFLLAEDGPEWIDAAQDIPEVYSAAKRQTLVRVPLGPWVDVDGLLDFVDGLGGRSLLFLQNVRRVSATDSADPDRLIEHSLLADAQASVTLRIRGAETQAEWTQLRDPLTGRSHDRYLAAIDVPKAERRRHKAIGESTAIGIAIPREAGDVGGVYDRLPLPVPSGFPFSVNAQFDPDAARTTILELPWNERRLEDLGELVAAAAIDCGRRDPSAAWYAIPLREELASGVSPWLAEHIRSGIIDRAQTRLVDEMEVTTVEGPRPLDALTFEDAALEGLITSDDQQRLQPDRFAIPHASRDVDGRWRAVLRDLGRSQELGVDKALELFDLEDDEFGVREPTWYVAMARAAIGAELTEDLLTKRSILLADDRRVEPPWSSDPRVLVAESNSGGLGTLLGIALPLHHAYLEDAHDARLVESVLREDDLLVDEADSPAIAFKVLARSRDDDMAPIRLDDDQLVALRDAFETLEDERQRDLGPKIGQNVELRGYMIDAQGRREPGWVRPVDAYLPSAIDRETGSFARAAGHTPGLWWLDGTYARVLKRAGGRRELGAQKFLVKLGAATQPRLVRPPNEVAPYARDPRPASPVGGVARPALQTREIRALSPTRSHLIEDRWSPDLEAVVASIEADRTAKRRRDRGLALLGVISRAWERHFADHATAKAVYSSYGWQDPREVIATWLARAADAAWLPSQGNRLRPPSELLLQTEENQLAYGNDRSVFLAPVDEAIQRGPAVLGLRIRRGPAASSLIARLRELAESDQTPQSVAEARGIYQLLALASPREGRSQPIDDMSATEFRAAFAPSARSPGLLIAGDAWHGPKDVLSGPPIFGRHRPFVPHLPSLRPLWRVLGVSDPTAADCIAVLRELAVAPLEGADVAVVLETTRALAALLGQMSTQLRTQLARIPLWTTDGWSRVRPMYAIEDPALASAVGDRIPMWDHGFTSLVGLEAVLHALRVTVIRREDFVPAGLTALDKLQGDQVRERFSSAAKHLRDELARGDQALHDSISIPWPELIRAEVFVDPDLALTWTSDDGTKVAVPAESYLSRIPVALIARTTDEIGSAEAGGVAIASLFDGDRQKVAWAWASMWQRAEAGRTSAGVVLSEQGGDSDDEAAARLLRLKDQAKARHGRNVKRGRPTKGTVPGATGPVVVRVLKDIADLEPDDGAVVNPGVSKPGLIFPGSSSVTRPEPDQSKGRSQDGDGDIEGKGGDPSGAVTSGGSPPAKRRTVLPPSEEREQLAFDAVQMALRLDGPEIADLRARRGIGADAMDDLRQLYEIKMASGELSNEITLTKNEAEAAKDSDFFLALVAGLEESDVILSVRFIFDPLRTLSQRITGDVTLVGLSEVQALEYKFRKPEGSSSE